MLGFRKADWAGPRWSASSLSGLLGHGMSVHDLKPHDTVAICPSHRALRSVRRGRITSTTARARRQQLPCVQEPAGRSGALGAGGAEYLLPPERTGVQEQTSEFTTSQNRALTFPEEETSTQGLGSPGTEQQILGTGAGGGGGVSWCRVGRPQV